MNLVRNLRDPETLSAVRAGLAVVVDRSTKWGNPYREGRDGTRDQAVAHHRVLVFRGLYDGELSELVEKDLACWCDPQACHAQNYLDRIMFLGLSC